MIPNFVCPARGLMLSGHTTHRALHYGRDGGRNASDRSVSVVADATGDASSRGGNCREGASPGLARNAASWLMPSRAMRATTASSAAAQARSDGAPGTSPANRTATSRSAVKTYHTHVIVVFLPCTWAAT